MIHDNSDENAGREELRFERQQQQVWLDDGGPDVFGIDDAIAPSSATHPRPHDPNDGKDGENG